MNFQNNLIRLIMDIKPTNKLGKLLYLALLKN